MTAPCPVCELPAHSLIIGPSTIRPWEYQVECPVCGTFGPLCPSKADAIKAWDDMAVHMR